MSDSINQILTFWFGDNPADARGTSEAKSPLWWGKQASADEEIVREFSGLLEEVAAEKHIAWRGTPRGRLAEVICLDQFSRVIHRGESQAFANDPAALALAQVCVAGGEDRQLLPIERVFLYLPFEHSEALDMQAESTRLYRALHDEAKPEERALFEETLKFARQHYDIIARFGRFPHRNAVLDRVSTPEELDFLTRPDSSF